MLSRFRIVGFEKLSLRTVLAYVPGYKQMSVGDARVFLTTLECLSDPIEGNRVLGLDQEMLRRCSGLRCSLHGYLQPMVPPA